MERDKELDLLRAFSMMWVILIHAIYWNGLFAVGISNIIRSFLLIEMPLLFFVTGASNMMSHYDNYFTFVLKRIKRVLIPYWLYVLIVCLINIDHGYTYDGMIESFILFQGYSGYSYTCWALWFIPVYIQIIIIFPLLKAYFIKVGNLFLKILPIFIGILCVWFCERLGVYSIRQVVFYAIFVYLGLFYNLLKNRTTYMRIAASIILIFGGFIIYIFERRGLYVLDMQNNKASVNIMFMVFAFSALSVFYLLWGGIKWGMLKATNCSILNKIMECFSKYSYSIFCIRH